MNQLKLHKTAILFLILLGGFLIPGETCGHEPSKQQPSPQVLVKCLTCGVALDLDLEAQKKFLAEVKQELYMLQVRLKEAESLSETPMKDRKAFQAKTCTKMAALNKRIDTAVRGKWIADSRLLETMEQSILPSLKVLNEKNKARTLELVTVTGKDLEDLRDRMESFLESEDFKSCTEQYQKARTTLGDFLFDHAAPLDPRFNSLMKEIEAINRRVRSVSDFQSIPVPIRPITGDKEVFAYQVMVVPRVGSKYEAVIRDPEVIALLKTGQLLDLKQFGSDDRLNLYYMRGMNGSMGVRVKDVKSVKALLSLSKEEMEEVKHVIGRRIESSKEKEKERIETLKVTQAQKAAAMREAAAKRKAQTKIQKEKEAERNSFPLLNKFPPENGWGPDKKKQLEWRKIVIKVFPKPDEQEFLDRFEAWSKQHEAWKALQDEKGLAENNKRAP